ncbi:MAG TPA: triose-phosphate isomerase [Gaiellales bacterium]|nr:triose-phosphate isomerase [Gaiellales bacterium]
MSRRPFVAGNWKMHKTAAEAAEFVGRLAARLPAEVDVALCPPFTALAEAAAAAAGLRIAIYAQNMHQAASGAYTGEISAEMILDTGAQGVLLGHSERRQLFGETDEGVNAKLAVAHEAGLWAIVAVGETEAEREAGETERVLRRQVEGALCDIGSDRVAETTIAYEPVWAIGTGRTATPAMAQAAHAEIRAILAELYGDEAAEAVRIQYGGSVKPDNAAGLFSEDEIDGGLIGGASLTVEDFSAILAAAVP